MSPVIDTDELKVVGPKIGEVWELRCVEVGGMIGYSSEVWKEANIQQPVQRMGFLTKLRWVKVTPKMEVSK